MNKNSVLLLFLGLFGAACLIIGATALVRPVVEHHQSHTDSVILNCMDSVHVDDIKNEVDRKVFCIDYAYSEYGKSGSLEAYVLLHKARANVYKEWTKDGKVSY